MMLAFISCLLCTNAGMGTLYKLSPDTWWVLYCTTHVPHQD